MFGGRLRDEFEFNKWVGHNNGPAVGDEAGDYWRKSRGSDRLLRWVSLLYTGFFFIEPYFRHNLRHWLWFAAFYVVFLALYSGITLTHNARLQKVLFGLLFLLGFVYYPFNSSASGVFVFPVVMLAFVMRSTRAFLIMLGLQVAALAAETWLLHLTWWSTLMGIFFCLVIGLSNLSYSRQKRAAFLLNRANDEIEHLAQVAERERIARDLHDLLGHTLTVIAMKSELANRILPIDPARAAQEMREIEQTARQALAEVREAVTGYRSEGLATEVGRARKTLASSGVQMTTDLLPIALTASQGNVLSLVLREAVTNIVRHARASACSLQLLRDGGDLRMVVADNGVGSEGADGNGLSGMRERVEALGGTVRRLAQPNSGTSLSVCLPLQRDQYAASRVAELRTTGAPFSPLDVGQTEAVPWTGE
ncbi:MAG: sensor histidine kinase [Janthinobacterium lividum]